MPEIIIPKIEMVRDNPLNDKVNPFSPVSKEATTAMASSY